MAARTLIARTLIARTLAAAIWLAACADGSPTDMPTPTVPEDADGAKTLRVATYNVSFYRDEPGQLVRDIAAWTDPQIEAVANVIRAADPDVLVLNEFDYDDAGAAVSAFAERLGYPYRLALPSNTGFPSGRDLDEDGRADHPPGSREYGADAFGYGTHPGQYAIAVMSRVPLDEAGVRTWRELLWRDVPGNRLPTGYYDEGDAGVLRLSSKTHAVVPVRVGGAVLDLVVAHPTPPGFDGAEDRNGRRNRDEVRLLHDIVDPDRGAYLTDDRGREGGLPEGAHFVIAGDLNADPADGDAAEAIRELLASPLVTDPSPRSGGAKAAAAQQGEANASQSGDAGLDTADFSDGGVGNLRVDYVLPSATLEVLDAGVFWPAPGEAGYELVGPGYPVVSSDHRLVWVDLALPLTDD